MDVVTVEPRGPVSIIRSNRPDRLHAIPAAGEDAFTAGADAAEAIAMAATLPEQAPLVPATLKRLAAEIVPVGPVERLVATSRAIARVRSSADMAEGIRADKEKRPPRFRGR